MSADDQTIRGNCLVCAVGRLKPQPPLQAEIDFGDGAIGVGSDDTKLAAELAAVAADSVVAVSGTLRRYQWTVGNGERRERLEIVAQRFLVLFDARSRRLLP